jgi:hypothetical protein
MIYAPGDTAAISSWQPYSFGTNYAQLAIIYDGQTQYYEEDASHNLVYLSSVGADDGQRFTGQVTAGSLDFFATGDTNTDLRINLTLPAGFAMSVTSARITLATGDADTGTRIAAHIDVKTPYLNARANTAALLSGSCFVDWYDRLWVCRLAAGGLEVGVHPQTLSGREVRGVLSDVFNYASIATGYGADVWIAGWKSTASDNFDAFQATLWRGAYAGSPATALPIAASTSTSSVAIGLVQPHDTEPILTFGSQRFLYQAGDFATLTATGTVFGGQYGVNALTQTSGTNVLRLPDGLQIQPTAAPAIRITRPGATFEDFATPIFFNARKFFNLRTQTIHATDGATYWYSSPDMGRSWINRSS